MDGAEYLSVMDLLPILTADCCGAGCWATAKAARQATALIQMKMDLNILYVSFFFLGIPLGWQSAHFTQWMLCLLSVERKLVSIFSTSKPQFDIFGWHSAQEARVFCPCFKWHDRQLTPSCTPIEVRSSPLATWRSEERRVGKECKSRWSPYQ